MSQRIADCLEVLDLVRSFARLAPHDSSANWRQKAVRHVASRGVHPETVYAHLVGKNTRHTLNAHEIDSLISGWINDCSRDLQHWLADSSTDRDLERVTHFFGTSNATPVAADISEPNIPERHLVSTYRVLRDTALARRVKADMNHTCQLCGERLLLGDGSPYAEAHHVKPLGAPHNGPDHPGNIICLCPNCHVKFDYGVVKADETKLDKVLPEFIAYHNENIYKKA